MANIYEIKDYLDERTVWNVIMDVSDAPDMYVKSFTPPAQGEKAQIEYLDKRKFQFEDGILPSQEPATFGNYQCTSYRCPDCGKRLYKTIFPKGNDPKLYTIVGSKEEFIEPARIFTCPSCQRFFATEKGKKLVSEPFQILHAGFGFDEWGQELFRRWLDYFNAIGDLYAQRSE